MKYIMLFIVLGLVSCSNDIKLGNKYGGKQDIDSKNKIIMPDGNYANLLKDYVNGYSVNIGVNKENTIVFISTKDENFETSNYRVGSIIESQDIQKISGWGNYIELKTGWFAAFENINTKEKKNKISWFFKFDFKNSTSTKNKINW